MQAGRRMGGEGLAACMALLNENCQTTDKSPGSIKCGAAL